MSPRHRGFPSDKRSLPPPPAKRAAPSTEPRPGTPRRERLIRPVRKGGEYERTHRQQPEKKRTPQAHDPPAPQGGGARAGEETARGAHGEGALWHRRGGGTGAHLRGASDAGGA